MGKDEILFFRGLQLVIGSRHLKSKIVSSGITSEDIFLDKDYRQYDFPNQITSMFVQLLKEFQSTGDVGDGTLSRHIDGLVVDHPRYGNRIIEFDEEQHFSTFREASLQHLSTRVDLKYLAKYRSYCYSPSHFHQMLKKHRLNFDVSSVPESVQEFIELIQAHAKSTSGFISPKTEFRFVGGRIAQRAYYDTLRDVAHLSEKNRLYPPLRFAKTEFEETASKTFSKIPLIELKELIERRLEELT